MYQDPNARILLMTQRSCDWLIGRALTAAAPKLHHRDSAGLTDALGQQLDVLEQKPAAILERDGTRRQSASEIGRLRQNPRIAQHTAADEHAFDT